MREAIHALKYDRLLGAGRRMGGMLAQAIAQLAADAPVEILVIPVPLHRSKHSQRGFNQARMLANQAIKVLRSTHPTWQLQLAASTVVRQRPTESQAGLTTRQRRLNVRGAFIVSNPNSVKDRNVLVVDDIFTTGATARSVSRALLRAGAANVWVATLARARRAFDHRSLSDAVYSDTGLDRGEIKEPPACEGHSAELETATLQETKSQPSF
jgi:ComF family protein